jgi:bifunctional DNA-binding transcriptional regulator/antitoxin component of YhaV-PrlF toxin-antitoxin module
MSQWIVTLEDAEDGSGDLMLPIPDEIMASLGLKIGDSITWDMQPDGSVIMAKFDTELVLVDCISQYRMRYLVEVPKGKKEWALDTVTMNEGVEFSQEHLGETIVSHRVISREDALKVCKEDNAYRFVSDLIDQETILSSLITREGK